MDNFNISNLKQINEILANVDESKNISLDSITKFFNENLSVFVSQIGKAEASVWHDELLKLSGHISEKFDNPEGRVLAFDVMGVAKGIFSASKLDAESVPNEIW